MSNKTNPTHRITRSVKPVLLWSIAATLVSITLISNNAAQPAKKETVPTIQNSANPTASGGFIDHSFLMASDKLVERDPSLLH